MNLPELLKSKIKTEGPISFRDFMDRALYYPGLGYYHFAQKKMGIQGGLLYQPRCKFFVRTIDW